MTADTSIDSPPGHPTRLAIAAHIASRDRIGARVIDPDRFHAAAACNPYESPAVTNRAARRVAWQYRVMAVIALCISGAISIWTACVFLSWILSTIGKHITP